MPVGLSRDDGDRTVGDAVVKPSDEDCGGPQDAIVKAAKMDSTATRSGEPLPAESLFVNIDSSEAPEGPGGPDTHPRAALHSTPE